MWNRFSRSNKRWMCSWKERRGERWADSLGLNDDGGETKPLVIISLSMHFTRNDSQRLLFFFFNASWRRTYFYSSRYTPRWKKYAFMQFNVDKIEMSWNADLICTWFASWLSDKHAHIRFESQRATSNSSFAVAWFWWRAKFRWRALSKELLWQRRRKVHVALV